MTTIRQTLEQGILTLTKAGQVNARLDAQVLLSHTLHVERSALYAYPERLCYPRTGAAISHAHRTSFTW